MNSKANGPAASSIEDQNKSTVLIFSQDSEQARGIEPFFRQIYEGAMGGTVVGRVLVGDYNWHEECADLLASHQPESVYIIAYANKTLEVLRLLKEKGYHRHYLRHLGLLLGRSPRAGTGAWSMASSFPSRRSRSNPIWR